MEDKKKSEQEADELLNFMMEQVNSDMQHCSEYFQMPGKHPILKAYEHYMNKSTNEKSQKPKQKKPKKNNKI